MEMQHLQKWCSSHDDQWKLGNFRVFWNTNPNMNVNMFAFPSVDEADRNTVTSGVDVLLAVS